jgi:predicted nucleic acid-binding protein
VPGRITEWSLDPGESATLALASECPGALAVLDDAEARACARVLCVPLIGTLAIVLLAKRRAAVPSVVAVIHDLRDAGFFVSDVLAA